MRQLMELMLDNYTAVTPTQSQLQTYLTENADNFKPDPSISFKHIYFSMEGRKLAHKTLSIKENPAMKKNFGSSLKVIPSSFNQLPKRQIASYFGNNFTDILYQLTTSEWLGPIPSGYGWHLVYLSEKIEANIPPLNQIWEKVERE